MGVAIYQGLLGNPDLPNPPVALAIFKAALDTYATLIAAAEDGGKLAIAQRNAQRKVVIKMIRQFANYVEGNCQDDKAIFTSSGFELVMATTVPPQPVDQPGILGIKHGISGQLLVSVTPRANVKYYELDCALVGDGETQPPSTTITSAVARWPIPVNGLMPLKTYAFRVRACGALGFTEWSDPATCVCL